MANINEGIRPIDIIDDSIGEDYYWLCIIIDYYVIDIDYYYYW